MAAGGEPCTAQDNCRGGNGDRTGRIVGAHVRCWYVVRVRVTRSPACVPFTDAVVRPLRVRPTEKTDETRKRLDMGFVQVQPARRYTGSHRPVVRGKVGPPDRRRGKQSVRGLVGWTATVAAAGLAGTVLFIRSRVHAHVRHGRCRCRCRRGAPCADQSARARVRRARTCAPIGRVAG